MGKTIAIIGRSGGKTTTAINLSASLAMLGHKTLVIDVDPQASLTSRFGIESREVSKTIYKSMLGSVFVNDIIIQTEIQDLDIIPANIDILSAKFEMIDLEDRELLMKKAIEPVQNKYEFIIIDCAPSLGLITVNALAVADTVLIPVQCEYYALEGLGKIFNTIKIIQENLNFKLSIEGVLLTMYDSSLDVSREILKDAPEQYKKLVFNTIIHRDIHISKEPTFRKSTMLPVATSRLATDYMNLAKEILGKNI